MNSVLISNQGFFSHGLSSKPGSAHSHLLVALLLGYRVHFWLYECVDGWGSFCRSLLKNDEARPGNLSV